MLDFDFAQLVEWGLPVIFSGGIGYVFATLYVAYGEAHSNRESFAQTFVLIAMTTTAIIMVIKQSIALSLGLVGALSIVRFRAAIKEPEELAFLFLMVAIGIGAGAGEFGMVLVFSIIILASLVARRFFRLKKGQTGSFNVNIVSSRAKEEGLDALLDILKQFTSRLSLKRFDEDAETLNVLVHAEFKNEDSFANWRNEIIKFDQSARLTFLDPGGVF